MTRAEHLSFSPLARLDLMEISLYIAGDNPLRAVTFTEELRKECYKLLSFPASSLLRDDLKKGMRMSRYKSYLIFYMSSEKEIRIERIIHGMRDLAELF